MANYVFFVSANPRELILIASTFTGIEIPQQIFIVLFGLIITQQIVFNKLNTFI